MTIMLALPQVGMMKTTIIVVPPQEVEGRDGYYVGLTSSGDDEDDHNCSSTSRGGR